MTTLLFLSGSQRRESFNGRLLRHLARRLAGQCVIDLVEPAQINLPIFDQDLEVEASMVQRISRIHQRFIASDAIVVASPEYNGQLTPYLKNIVDWTSRLPHIDASFENPFQDRPLLICSASTGWSGGAVAMPQARALFGYVGCMVLGDSINIPYADQAWTPDGYMFDPLFEDRIDNAVNRLLQMGETFYEARHTEALTA